MSARVSRLSESSDSSTGDVEPPKPKPPPPPTASTQQRPSVINPPPRNSEEAALDARFNKRYTPEDPNFAEILNSEPLPPPVIPEYRGRSFRGGRGGGGGGDGQRQGNSYR